MEEILIERTIKVLFENLEEKMTKVWKSVEDKLAKLGPAYQERSKIPFVPTPNDFFRFSLGERISNKNYRFIVSCQRSSVDTTDRGEVANEYELEIVFLYDYKFDGRSRYYIPMRVREAIMSVIEDQSRHITGRSSNITLGDIQTAEATAKGSRTVMAGVVYKIIA